jgi:hypothetical protein
MVNKNNRHRKEKQPTYKDRDDRLLQKQQALTEKISKCDDESLIKIYLRECHEIALQRLGLRKGNTR